MSVLPSLDGVDWGRCSALQLRRFGPALLADYRRLCRSARAEVAELTGVEEELALLACPLPQLGDDIDVTTPTPSHGPAAGDVGSLSDCYAGLPPPWAERVRWLLGRRLRLRQRALLRRQRRAQVEQLQAALRAAREVASLRSLDLHSSV